MAQVNAAQSPAIAQDDQLIAAQKAAMAQSQHQQKEIVQPHQPPAWWSATDAMTISAAVLIFGIMVLAIAAYLIRHERNGLVILKVLATVIILVLTVFLVVAGYDVQQIAPAIGLLGTVAGYLLGKETGPHANGALPPTQKHDAIDNQSQSH